MPDDTNWIEIEIDCSLTPSERQKLIAEYQSDGREDVEIVERGGKCYIRYKKIQIP